MGWGRAFGVGAWLGDVEARIQELVFISLL